MFFSLLKNPSSKVPCCPGRSFVNCCLPLVGIAGLLLTLASGPIVTADDVAEPVIAGKLCVWDTVTIDLQARSHRKQTASRTRFSTTASSRVYWPFGATVPRARFLRWRWYGGGEGNVWRVRFTPDESGEWNTGLLSHGKDVAISLDPPRENPRRAMGNLAPSRSLPSIPTRPAFSNGDVLNTWEVTI